MPRVEYEDGKMPALASPGGTVVDVGAEPSGNISVSDSEPLDSFDDLSGDASEPDVPVRRKSWANADAESDARRALRHVARKRKKTGASGKSSGGHRRRSDTGGLSTTTLLVLGSLIVASVYLLSPVK
jgi:hypothetical protein